MQFEEGPRNNWFTRFQEGDFEVVICAGHDVPVRRKLRFFVAGEEPVDYSPAHEMAQARNSYMKGTDVETDKLFAKLRRQQIANKREMAQNAIESVVSLGRLIGDHKLRFSSKAGCSCGCSPGFIVATMPTVDVGSGVHARVTDIFIDNAN